MTTVGFSFNKLNAEKKNISEQNIRVENNVGITNIEEGASIDNKKSIVRFEFDFKCRYEPGLATIELGGELLEMYDKELSIKILDSWKTDKKIHQDIMAHILNSILSKANIEAILISKELGLPSPIAMPKVEVKDRPPEAKTETKLEAKKEEQKKEDKPKKK